MAYVHLHTHSDHTLLDSVLTVDQLAARAAELGQTHVALTDTGVLHGVVDFNRACKKHGVKPIFGASCWVTGFPGQDESFDVQLVLLVENELGWANLCRLLTLGLAQICYHPRVTLDQLEEHRAGLIVLTGGTHGLLARASSTKHALDLFGDLSQVIDPGSLYVEIVDHGTPGHAQVVERADSILREYVVDQVVTGEPRHLTAQDVGGLHMVRAVASKAVLSDRRDGLLSDQAWVKSEAELREVFPEHPWAIDRSQTIAERCTYELPMGRMLLPVTEPPLELESDESRWDWMVKSFPWPAWIKYAPSEDAPIDHKLSPVMLREFAWAGLYSRVTDSYEAYADRLEHELDVIISMGFDSYFLIVSEMVSWARAQDIPVGPGRGSAAGSLVAWCLGITDLDPIRWDLLFERFLNAARGKKGAPDIDLDFAQERRGEVIQHLRDRYGHDRAAQILTIGTFAGLSAVKDCARVHRVYFRDSNDWTSRMEDILRGSKDQSLRSALRNHSLATLSQISNVFHSTMEHAQAIEGLARQTGIHPGAVVVADRPIVDVLPMHSEGSVDAIGGDMTTVETLGLVKFDVLGVKALDVIQRACELIKETTGEEVDPGLFPEDDPDTFELLCKGDLHGIFQLKSTGMRRLCRQLKPSVIDDVCALVALYRPGPLSSGMTQSYIERKHGNEEATPIHPLLADLLAPTYGLLVYQEQVMQAAQVVAGYDLAEADLLRRAMGKKKPEEMAKQRVRFVSGCVERGTSEEDADSLFDTIDRFSGYGFNKSHSAAYGLICWRTAYLKAHWPGPFMAAVMTWEDKKGLPQAVDAARHMRLPILPPDVQESRAGFSIERGAIRFGFGSIKGIGPDPARALEHLAPGVLRPEDLRGQINRTTAKALAAAGAFDRLEPDRLLAIERAAPAQKPKKRLGPEAELRQGILIPTLVKPQRGTDPDHQIRGQTWAERNKAELNALGVILSADPLERYEDVMPHARGVLIEDVLKQHRRRQVKLAVVIETVRKEERPRSPTVWHLRFSDPSGSLQGVLAEDTAIFDPNALTPGTCLQVYAEVNPRTPGKLTVSGLEDLEVLRDELVHRRRDHEQVVVATLTLEKDSFSQTQSVELAEVLRRNPGNTQLKVRWERHGETVALLDHPEGITASIALFEALERLTGDPQALMVR